MDYDRTRPMSSIKSAFSDPGLILESLLRIWWDVSEHPRKPRRPATGLG